MNQSIKLALLLDNMLLTIVGKLWYLYFKNPLRVKPCRDIFNLSHKIFHKSKSSYPTRLVNTILDCKFCCGKKERKTRIVAFLGAQEQYQKLLILKTCLNFCYLKVVRAISIWRAIEKNNIAVESGTENNKKYNRKKYIDADGLVIL